MHCYFFRRIILQNLPFLHTRCPVLILFIRTSGSSRESGLAIDTNDGCIVSANPTVVPESHTPTTVDIQTREGVERDEGDAMTNVRPQRKAARQQRALLGRLIEDDLL